MFAYYNFLVLGVEHPFLFLTVSGTEFAVSLLIRIMIAPLRHTFYFDTRFALLRYASSTWVQRLLI